VCRPALEREREEGREEAYEGRVSRTVLWVARGEVRPAHPTGCRPFLALGAFIEQSRGGEGWVELE